MRNIYRALLRLVQRESQSVAPSRSVRGFCWLLLLFAALAGPSVGSPPATLLARSSAASRTDSDAESGLLRLTSDGLLKQRPSWSRDGRKLVFARHRSDKIWLYLWDRGSGTEKRLTTREHPEYDAAWSPDSSRLAFSFVGISGPQGDVDVYVIGPDGGGLTRIAGTDGSLSHEEWPSWSPDGKRIAFTSTRAGNQEVFTVDADGKNLTRLTSDLGTDAHPAWSPDGSRVAFATDRWGGLEIATMKLDGSDVRRLTNSPGLDDYPAWSPDGGWLAFTSHRDGNPEIYRLRSDGTGATNISNNRAIDSFPTWGPDAGDLTYVSNRDSGFDIYIQRAGSPRVSD